MLFQKFIRGYLHFSKRDRTGVLILVFLILVIYFLPLLFERSLPIPFSTEPALAAAADSFLSAPPSSPYPASSYPSSSYENSAPSSANPSVPPRLFRFDPNTLSDKGWLSLGLPERSIRTLLHYREKGGRFRHPEDLQKIWGLPPGFYDRVKDSIFIEGASSYPNRYPNPSPLSTSPQSLPYSTNLQSSRFSASDHSYSYPASSYPRFEKKPLAPIGINTADTAAFIALPGIGSRLASRVITFRDRLGGFYSISQVAETYGLPDSTFQKIKPYLRLDGALKKLHLNTATEDELKAHPYIRWKLAHAIIEYRRQHGPFQSPSDLKNITLITDSLFSKMAPYMITD